MAKELAKRNVFGEFLQEMLIKQNMSLRELARKTGLDPSNLSKIERGVCFPPQKKETLEKMVKALGLNKVLKQHFSDLSRQVNSMLPEDLEDIKQNVAIPLLLRTIEKRRLTYEETIQLAKAVEEENMWQGKIVE